MSTDTYLAPEEIVKLFGDCRIVDGMQWVYKEPDPQAYNQENLSGETYRVGCAMRFDEATEDNQRLLQYAWFVHMPNGEYAVGNFLDTKEINTAIDAARAGDKRKDEDPSVLLGQLLDQDAKRLGKIKQEKDRPLRTVFLMSFCPDRAMSSHGGSLAYHGAAISVEYPFCDGLSRVGVKRMSDVAEAPVGGFHGGHRHKSASFALVRRTIVSYIAASP